MEVLIVIWLACGVASGMIASGKGRSGGGWFVLGFLFGPLGLLAAAIISPNATAVEQRRIRAGMQAGNLRPCPKCAEPIQKAATLCRYCNSEIAPTLTVRN